MLFYMVVSRAKMYSILPVCYLFLFCQASSNISLQQLQTAAAVLFPGRKTYLNKITFKSV